MYTIKKEERLCNKKLIDELFHNGSSFLCYPFKVSWLYSDELFAYPAQILLSVSKKRFKRAVDRNLIKRRTREAYRLHKKQYLYGVLDNKQKKILLSLGYIGKDIAGYDLISKKMFRLLTQLSVEISK